MIYFILLCYFLVVVTHAFTRANTKPELKFIRIPSGPREVQYVTEISKNAYNLNRIFHESRRSGTTSWILFAAKHNPHCIILTHNEAYAGQLQRDFLRMLGPEKLYQSPRKPIQPAIMSIERCLQTGYLNGREKLPVIIDNKVYNIIE